MRPTALKLRKQLRTALAKLKVHCVELSGQPAADDIACVLFDLDGHVAGIAQRLLCGSPVPRRFIPGLARPFLVRDQLQHPDGRVSPLGDLEDHRAYAARIERVRQLCFALLERC